MKIRGEISYELQNWAVRPDRPMDDNEIQLTDQAEPRLNPELFLPDNAQQLATIREHCIDSPQGILLDTYQAVTELELKYPSGSPEARERYATGLREEVIELSAELKEAQREHPYHEIDRFTEGPADTWLNTVLDYNRLRFNDLKPERKDKCLSEMGDIIWYSSRLAAENSTNLSQAFLAFLRSSGAGNLRDTYTAGYGEDIENRGESILDFRLVQDISLSQKLAFTERVQIGTPLQKLVSIDNAPYILLNRIIDDELSQPPANIKETIGKIIWFVAYTSNSILNADFATVMQANLEKITARSQVGTIFSKDDRRQADESQPHTEHNPRVPLRHIVDT